LSPPSRYPLSIAKSKWTTGYWSAHVLETEEKTSGHVSN
jgi:hypothetical protein